MVYVHIAFIGAYCFTGSLRMYTAHFLCMLLATTGPATKAKHFHVLTSKKIRQYPLALFGKNSA